MNNLESKKFHIQSGIMDCTLWKEFKNGNHLAFSTLYDCYVDILFRYGCSISRDSQMVEDAIQDIFIYLWHNRKTTGEVDNVKLYLFKVLRHDLLKKIKLETSTGNNLECHQEEFIDQCLVSYQEELTHQNDEAIQRRLRELVNLLDGRQREVLYLRLFQEMSYEQIASLLEIDIKYTYNIFSRAINQLKKHLAGGFDLFAE
jgi:RNA polymerase sigma factor (sigma-70 family)